MCMCNSVHAADVTWIAFSDDAGGDVFGSIDTLLFLRHSKCLIHAGYAWKVEGLDNALKTVHMTVHISHITCVAYSDDGSGDVLGSVDDLLDTRHSKRHIHAGNTSKVEGLERHLCARLSNTLRPKSTHSGTCKHSNNTNTDSNMMYSNMM